MLAGLDVAIWRSALQGGAVAAGRETMASAISIQLLCEPAWETLFKDLQRDLREPAFDRSRAENLSEELAHRWRALADDPGFVGPFESNERLNAAHPLLNLLVGSLGVAPSCVAARLRSVPADPAIDMIAGGLDIERDLSVAAVKELCPEWPGVRESAPHAPIEQPAQRPRAPWLRAEALGGAPVPHPDQRPMFTEVGSRWGAEGLILGVLVALMVLGSIWNLATTASFVPPLDFANLETGPGEFPIDVHIDGDNISFTSRAAESSDCVVALGRDAARAYTATFVVSPLETRRVPSRDFRGPHARPPDADSWAAAQEHGLVTCASSSGGTRVFRW
jgi:hypothetical protein